MGPRLIIISLVTIFAIKEKNKKINNHFGCFMFLKIENNKDCYIKYSNPYLKKKNYCVTFFKVFLKRFGCVLHNYCVFLKIVLKF